MKANVGITVALEKVNTGPWTDMESAVVPFSYVRSVRRAGGRSLLLSPDPDDILDPTEVLALIDALIITGGPDIHPSLYGQDSHPKTGPTQEERDAYEIALVHAALESNTPLLGICRGGQIINVAYGGTLEQHLPDILGHERHLCLPGTFSEHEVRLKSDSLAARTVGARTTVVKSHHHQGVKEIGKGLRATGWTTEDDIVEAFEDPEHPFMLGVLWHPEEDERSKLIKILVEEARDRSATGAIQN